jgi:hypothetical protein
MFDVQHVFHHEVAGVLSAAPVGSITYVEFAQRKSFLSCMSGSVLQSTSQRFSELSVALSPNHAAE